MDRARRLAFILLACACVLGVARAEAPSAKSLYDSGMKHYNLAELDAALRDFKEAYRLKPDPAFLFNIAQCHRRLDDPATAATFYRSYLRESPEATNRAEVNQLLAEMDAAVAAKAKAKADAEAQAREAEAQRAREAEQQRAAQARPVEGSPAIVAAPPPPRKPVYKKAWFWGAVVGGAAVVGLAVGLGVGLGVKKDPAVSLGSAVVQ
jgi:tetratricopeptide (TPR) repeat protein